MSNIKTVTGYALALIVILSLVIGACGIETSTVSSQPAPAAEDLDSYDEEQMLAVYDATVDAISGIITRATTPQELDTQCAWHKGNREASIDSFMSGFLRSMPDEMRYLVAEEQMRSDVGREIDEACFFASIGQE